jgi:hypothetical protein
LKSIAETSGELAWVQASNWKRDCDLHDGSDVVATLRWQSAFRAAAVAGTAESLWHFRLEGFLLKQWIRIEQVSGGDDRATFQGTASLNGILEYGDGRGVYWDSNFWLTKWIWSDEKGFELMRVQRNLSLKTEGTITYDTSFLGQREIPLLTVLGWYIIMVLSDIRPG